MKIKDPWQIGSLELPHRVIQGPLAGYSCAPFRQLFSHFAAPAYAVSEMISAQDVLSKHAFKSRYLWRDPKETRLCYQLAGHDPETLAHAAKYLMDLGADLIDLNCGCPKNKIRKKGAGSALLETPTRLITIVERVRQAIQIPLTVKIRIYHDARDVQLAHAIQQAGADALIVHGRHWQDDYEVACDMVSIAAIKRAVNIPVIANGDIVDITSLEKMMAITQCDGYMIARAGCGNPQIYQQLLTWPDESEILTLSQRIFYFMQHLEGLAYLENEFRAVLQSKSLLRYYFNQWLDPSQLQVAYQLNSLAQIGKWLNISATN